MVRGQVFLKSVLQVECDSLPTLFFQKSNGTLTFPQTCIPQKSTKPAVKSRYSRVLALDIHPKSPNRSQTTRLPKQASDRNPTLWAGEICCLEQALPFLK